MKRLSIIFAAAMLGGTAFAQTTLNLSADLVRLGIASANMAPNQPSLDAGPLFFRGVSYAQSHKIGRVIADTGAYYFLSRQWPTGPHVSWDQISNLTIDLQGSDLYFSFPLADGILITRSTNIVLQNFTVDYNPLPFTQVRVVSVDAVQRQIQFAVDGAWQNPSVLNAVFAIVPAGVGSVEVHIFRNGRPIQGVPRMYAVNPVGSDQFTIVSQGGNPTAAALALIRPGDTAFLGMRTAAQGPVSAANCTGCTFRNITAYSSVEWAVSNFISQSCVYERIYSIPRPGTDRLLSTFGGVELAATGPGNQIRLSRMIGNMDNSSVLAADALGTVKSQTDSRTCVLEGASTTWLQLGLSVPNGSNVAFQKPSDASSLGSAVIVSQVAPPYTGQNPYQITFTFDRDLPAAIVGSVAYGLDSSQRGANSVIERNAFERATDCCRGFLVVGLVDSVVRGNYIRGAPMTALHVENALSPALVSPPVANLTISNNVIDRTNWTTTSFRFFQLGAIEVVTEMSNGAPATVTAHQNVVVTGNFIADSGTAAIWMGNTNGGSVTGNYFLNPNNNPAVEAIVSSLGATQPLILQGSENVAAANNVVDQTSGRVWITDSQYRELAAYAPGSVVRLNAYGLGTFFPGPSLTLTDADGNTTPATIQSTMAHAIDVQIPASAGLGGAYLTLTSGNLKYFGTLFLDSQDNIPALNRCTYEVSPASTSLGASASNLPILVITQAGCSYQILATDSFVSPGAGATGTAVISAGFAANSGSARNTTIEIAGQPFTVTESAPSAAGPTIQAIQDSWNYTSGVAPGTWVTITGTGLASGPPRIWNLNGVQTLPTTLGGATVSFNGTPAALYYVSATQINALVPAAVAPGPVQVIVQSNGVNSSSFTITATATLPAIYAPPNADGSTFFVTAALAGTATLIGNHATDPRVLRAAQPGDTLDLYMIGLGSTEDPSKFVTNQLFAGAYPVSAPVTVTVGGKPATPLFAGLISPGLYLVRIAVPKDLTPGPQAIQVTAGASQTRSSLVLMLQAG